MILIVYLIVYTNCLSITCLSYLIVAIGFITLKDLKSSQLTSLFLNTFINLEKYMDYEQRDAVSMNQVRDQRISSERMY